MIDYNSKLNSTIKNVKPSGIRKFFDIVNEMDNVISLSIGEPDFQTPWHVREAGVRSLVRGKTWYTPNRGFQELRDEISKYMQRKFELSYDSKTDIVVTVGGSEAIDLAIRTLVNPGEEVLIPSPSFVCYEPLTQMAGAIPVAIETKAEDKFKLTPEELLDNITDKTKVLILPYPNNPTGGIMTREDLEKIAKVIIEKDLLVISDEIYSELTYNGKHVSIANIENMKERTVVINGFSKSFAMTGWRLGFACGPKEILEMMTKLHQFAIMSAPTTAQYAAIEALKNGEHDIVMMRDEYDMRRKLVVNKLNEIGLETFMPEGAFYCFPCIKSTNLSSEEFCQRLLKEKKVALVPGTAFGDCGEGFCRLSYCYSLKHLKKALTLIEEFIGELN